MSNLPNIYKTAKANSNVVNLINTISQMLIFWLVFLYVLPKFIVYLELSFTLYKFTSLPYLAWIGFALLSLLGLWSAYTMSWLGKGTPLPMDCANELVIAGPYKFVRNPMAVAGIGQAICVGLIFGSYLVIIYALIGALIWQFFVKPSEERDLESRFGKDYLDYKSKIKCWIPSFGFKKI